MVPVLTRYFSKGPINNEWECTECGKVAKDPRFRKKDKPNQWKDNRGANRESQRRPDFKRKDRRSS